MLKKTLKGARGGDSPNAELEAPKPPPPNPELLWLKPELDWPNPPEAIWPKLEPEPAPANPVPNPEEEGAPKPPEKAPPLEGVPKPGLENRPEAPPPKVELELAGLFVGSWEGVLRPQGLGGLGEGWAPPKGWGPPNWPGWLVWEVADPRLRFPNPSPAWTMHWKPFSAQGGPQDDLWKSCSSLLGSRHHHKDMHITTYTILQSQVSLIKMYDDTCCYSFLQMESVRSDNNCTLQKPPCMCLVSWERAQFRDCSDAVLRLPACSSR